MSFSGFVGLFSKLNMQSSSAEKIVNQIVVKMFSGALSIFFTMDATGLTGMELLRILYFCQDSTFKIWAQKYVFSAS